jgi:hypothetical protein
MSKKWLHPVVLSIVVLSACTSVETVQRPTSYYDEGAESSRLAFAKAPEPVSLFSSDSAVLSDEDIKRILSHRFSLQKQNRIGILTIGRSYWFGWSDELARAGADVQSELIGKLRSSPYVFDASYLPTLLIPEKKTVGYFREAAARYQADLLLLYQASCRTYEKYRFFSPDKSKSYCNVEAVLIDTRTGIVPFTVTASRDFIAEKSPTDMNLTETIRRAELTALRAALGEAGDRIVSFLGSAGR